jgi:hypothetical protein
MNNNINNPVMVVYAIDKSNNSTWIYGVYTDCEKGFDIQNRMQNNKEYSYLYWDNNIVPIDKVEGAEINEKVL